LIETEGLAKMTLLSEIASTLSTTEKNVNARLVGLRIAPVCGRCGGTGRYSFNQTDGDRCYGCNGQRYVAPKESDLPSILEAARECVADGRLEMYLKSLASRAVVKKAGETLMAAWTSTKVATVNSNIGHMAKAEEHEGLAKLRAANAVMCEAYRAGSDAASKLDARSETYTEDCLAVAAIVEAAIKTIADADYDVPASLVEVGSKNNVKSLAARAARFGGF
jgi:hypothetical protein